MATTQITVAKTATIPLEIIEWLHLKSGDQINITIAPDGKVYLEPAIKPKSINVLSLSCCLYNPERKTVYLDEMEKAIIDSAGESM